MRFPGHIDVLFGILRMLCACDLIGVLYFFVGLCRLLVVVAVLGRGCFCLLT